MQNFVCLVSFGLTVVLNGQTLPITNPGFEKVYPRDLEVSKITNGARGTGNLVGTRLSFNMLPQFNDQVDVAPFVRLILGKEVCRRSYLGHIER